jgi:hypothetical protein
MSFSNVCAEGELDMEYELRVVVEKVFVSTQEVVKRDTLKTYDVKPPESILELGLRHAEQIALLGKVQDAILAVQAKLIDPGHDVCPRCGDKLKKNNDPLQSSEPSRYRRSRSARSNARLFFERAWRMLVWRCTAWR